MNPRQRRRLERQQGSQWGLRHHPLGLREREDHADRRSQQRVAASSDELYRTSRARVRRSERMSSRLGGHLHAPSESDGAKATAISSGDNEGHAHPRPVVIGASGFYGSEVDEITKRERLPLLVYATELARSAKLASATSVRVDKKPEPSKDYETFGAARRLTRAGRSPIEISRTRQSRLT